MGHSKSHANGPSITARAHGFENSCGIFILILATGAILAKAVRGFFPH